MVEFVSSSGFNPIYENKYNTDTASQTQPLTEDEIIIRALDGLAEMVNKKPMDEKENAIRAFIKNEVATYFSDKISSITGSEDISGSTEFLLITIDKYAPRVSSIAAQATGNPTLTINSEDVVPQSDKNIEIDLLNPGLSSDVKQVAAENISAEVVNKFIEKNIALEAILEKIQNGEKLTEDDLKVIFENQDLFKELQELSTLLKEHGLNITIKDSNGKDISLDQMISSLTEKQQVVISQIIAELQTQIINQVNENRNLTNIELIKPDPNNYNHESGFEDTNLDKLRNSVLAFKSMIIHIYQDQPNRLDSIVSELQESMPESELNNTIINSLKNSVELVIRKNVLRTNTIRNINDITETTKQNNIAEKLAAGIKPTNESNELVNNGENQVSESIVAYSEVQIAFINTLNSFKPFMQKAINNTYKIDSQSINKNYKGAPIVEPEPKSIKPDKHRRTLPGRKDNEKAIVNNPGQLSDIETPLQINEFTNSNYLLKESLSVLEYIFENPAEIVKYDFHPTKFRQLVYSIKETLNNMIRNNDVLMFFNQDTVKQLVKIKSILNLFYVELAKVDLANEPAANSLNRDFSNNTNDLSTNNYSDLTRAAINSSQSLPVLAQALLEKIKGLLKTIMTPPKTNSAKTAKKRRAHSEEDPDDRSGKNRQKTIHKNITEI